MHINFDERYSKMPRTRFSHRLTVLMKKRKISGQKLGDMIGKSQKTISRYANGEVEPSNEVKNKIYAAIAKISGIEEDGLTEEVLELRALQPTDYVDDDSIGKMAVQENEISYLDIEHSARIDSLTQDFEKLSIQEKKYYLENFFWFHQTNERDFELVYEFNLLTGKKQQEVILFLENFNVTYESLRYTEKIATILYLVEKSQERPIDIKEETPELQNDAIVRIKFAENIQDLVINAVSGNIPYHPVFLKYTPMDWYFLFRVMIFELCDKGASRLNNDNKIFNILKMYRDEGK